MCYCLFNLYQSSVRVEHSFTQHDFAVYEAFHSLAFSLNQIGKAISSLFFSVLTSKAVKNPDLFVLFLFCFAVASTVKTYFPGHYRREFSVVSFVLLLIHF